MFTSPDPGPVNGHASSLADEVNAHVSDGNPSDSDLSDAQPAEARAATPASVDAAGSPDEGPAFAPEEQEESESEPSDNDAVDDGDFDAPASPASIQSNDASDHDASASGHVVVKRKAAQAIEDVYMRENPELYGLRRSSRPVQRRKVVDSDDEEEGSESDAMPAPRKTANKRRRLERSLPASKRGTPARQTSADDSDSDNYGGAKARSFQKKARRQQELQPALALAEKRWSSRRAAQVSAGAYQESEVDEEEDEDETTPAYWAVDVEDNSPYIEKILRHRPKEGVEITPNATRHDFEYYIKWQGKSHLHNTWETTETVAGFRGFRRLENYYKKMVEYELDLQFGGDEISPEQREQWLLDREREEEALEDFTKVERVVAVRDGDDGHEYFVKWKGLQYDDCTWEDASLISSHAQDKIDQYLDRASRSWQSDRKQSNFDTRSRMTKLEQQPSYIKNGELREFQMKGLNFLALNWTRGNNVILADEMGLGKTVQTVSFLSWLRNDRGQEGPFLVVAPLSVIPAWCDTFNHWAPDINYVVYLGPEAARANIRNYELFVDGNTKKTKFNVLVTSYDYILADADHLKGIKWQALAVDEAHRLKNRESQLYFKLNSFNVPCKVLITGTPIQNNLAELGALLDFLNPGKVRIDEELELLSTADNDAADDEEAKRIATQEKLRELHAAIAPFILRRTKETVESDLPPKTEKIIRVELSDVQLEYYKNILTRNYAALSDVSNGHKQSLLNIMMELKKVSNHPYMFLGVEDRVLAGSTRREDQIKGLITSSGKMMLLDQLLAKLRKDGHRVLIFSQMVKMLDILGDYLRIRGYQFQRLDGTIPAGPRRMAINHFNAEGSEDFCFLLSTRAGGLGINLMTADTVIIYDSDWNPQADLQAMARAHRIGQKRPVNVYRLVAKQTIEEEVVKRARNKLFLEYLTIQAGVTDEGKALREQFKERGMKLDEAKTAEDISMILKMRSQNLFEQSGNQEKLEQLDIDAILENAEVTKTGIDDKINLSSGGIDWDNWMQFTDVKVDDLALDWDQIIPADELAAIKAEEEKQKHEEYLARAVEENAPRKAALKGSKKNIENDRAERLAKKRQREKQELEELEEQRALLSDPRRPLNEKETRNLIRAFFRYGFFDDREEEIVHDARLSDRDRDFLKSIIDDLVVISKTAMDANAEKLREEEERAGKPLAKKDKKAVLVDFGDVRKVNAETVVERPPQLKLLHRVLQDHGDAMTFRLPDASKAAQYSCEWGAREDAMLLIGIDKYGFGAWTQIRDDPELQMHDKFFLEEHRVDKKEERKKTDDKGISSPGAVHLVRRSEYLLSVLMAKYSNDANAKKAVENHHRSKKLLTNGVRRGEGGSVSASPGPALSKKPGQHRDRDHHRSYSNANDRGTPRPDKRKYNDDYDDRNSKHRRVEADSKHEKKPKEKERPKMDPETMERYKRERQKAVERFQELAKLRDDEIDNSDNAQLVWSVLRPLKSNMERIMYSKERVPAAKERAKILGEEIRNFGFFLKSLRAESETDLASLEPQFWEFLSSIWPLGDIKVSGKRLQKMFGDLTVKDRVKQEEDRTNDQRRARNPDLEDGEIASDREERRPRDPYRDDRREERREERRDERRDDRREEPRRRNYYDEGDRLNFHRHRRTENRNVPLRHSSWQSRSPPARHSPY